MPRDELRQPLRKRSLSERLWARRPSGLVLASVLASGAFLGASAWIASKPHPFAGEPVLTVTIPPLEVKTASTEPVESEAEAAAAPEEQAAETPPEADLQLAPEPAQPAIIVASRRPMKAAPIAAVSEETPDGKLPRVASNGKRPFDVYAQITPMAALSVDQPKIAILLGGMGLNARLTQKAITDLPGDVTFGFAPYGSDLQVQVNKARAQGHEVMLQLPMEPMGYPANDPGPNTLLAEAAAPDNLKSLRWNMSRFAGYTGISNYMGSRFLSTPESLKPVLAELRARGLVFLEDSAIAMSSTAAVAKAAGLKTRRADLVIDAKPDAASIRAALDRLEDLAKANGMAVGTGAGLEITIDTVAEWARELQGRGIMLVPVSAAYRGQLS